MQISAIKTAIINQGDSLFQSIIAITSKVVSYCQQRIVPKNLRSKYALVKKEADAYLAEDIAMYDTHLTIKQHRIIPSAGIDESNVADAYILHPENSQQTAEDIWRYLCDKHKLTELGVIITDSVITPLRAGVTGACLGWCGFEPLYNYVGAPDIFAQPLRMTQINLLDALATSAVLVMGEGAEQTPLARIQQAPKITFQNRIPSQEEKQSIFINPNDDLFAPLLNHAQWTWSDH
jgi:putative folate metabolism gamma-glutamate ligase